MSEVMQDGDKIIVKQKCDIVASRVEELKTVLKQAVDNEPIGLIIDLTEVEMIDSMGIGLLIATHNSLQKKGGELELTNASADIAKLLQNMRLDKHFLVS